MRHAAAEMSQPLPPAAAGIKYQDPLRGFTLLELVVVIAIISLLATVAAERLWEIQVKAERAAMESVIGALQSALGMQVADALLSGERRGLETLADSNPMERLAAAPNNYVGALADATEVGGAQWYFDLRERVLVYRAYNVARFRGGAANPAQIRFVVRLDYEVTRTARRDQGIVGARLVALEPYAWSDPAP